MLVLLQALALVLTPSALPPQATLPLPPARGPLVFEPGTTEIGLDQLLARFAELTGQELALTQAGRQQAHQARELLESTSPVPAQEVYPFVEGLLARQGFVIAPLSGGTRPILGVMVPMNRPDGPLDPLTVGAGALSELDAHPALYARLLVCLEHSDARQIQTQVRQLIFDPTNLTQCVPVGETCLILQGRARDIAGLARVLAAADEFAGSHPASGPAAEEATK